MSQHEHHSQTIGVYASSISINDKSEITDKKRANITKALHKVTRKNLVVLTISIPYGSHAKLRIDCVAMFINYSGMEQDLHTNTSKYGVQEST